MAHSALHRAFCSIVIAAASAFSNGQTASAPTSARNSPSAARPGYPADGAADLSAADRAAGWHALFDGKSSAGWRGYKAAAFPTNGWEVADGCLKASAGGSDIITTDTFGDFELIFEWKVLDKGNSGVMYHVVEDFEATWQSGPEYQIRDDAGAGLAATDERSTGALYEMAAPQGKKPLHPAGEFNTGRIVVVGGIVQHWVNGAKVVDVSTDLPSWREKLAASKFKADADFGTRARGHIALQCHGDPVWFRNLRIRDLSGEQSPALAICNGQNLTGWRFVAPDNAPVEKTWRIADGTLHCTGEPKGYLRTTRDFSSYVLMLQWRWNPETKKTGNSGVLLGCTGEDKVWPRCIEAQLQADSAGDFWNLGEFAMKTDPARTNGKNTRKLAAAELPPGQWNQYVISVHDGRIVLRINGQVVNTATDVPPLTGGIGLQSEGTEIQFRDIRLIPLD